MIRTRWRGIAYRAHNPQFAYSPTSGEGARIVGGRFNPIGVPALYLATSLESMLLEVSAGFQFGLMPFTICSYEVDMEDIVDLHTPEAFSEAGFDFSRLTADWRTEKDKGETPYSWTVALAAIAEEVAGALVPSFAAGARPDQLNLVLWTWSDRRPHMVKVIDPDDRLPKDDRSWRPKSGRTRDIE